MSVLPQAAKTKYHRLGVLNNTNVLLTVLEAGKSKIKVPTDVVSGASTLPGLQLAAFSLCPPMDESKLSDFLVTWSLSPA